MMKEEKKVRTKWSEIEHLPEWDEEYYLVYTAKKYGKWVMLKTLRPEYRDNPEYQQMLEKEFDVRYNLAHPNIVMINDLEDVPGLGLCIIADDVYGKSLRKLIAADEIDSHILGQVTDQLVQAIEYIQRNHIEHSPITSDRVIFTENIRNLKVIDVGFARHRALTKNQQADDIYNYGVILNELLDAYHKERPDLRKIAARCMSQNPKNRYANIEDLKLALNNHGPGRIYGFVIVFLICFIAVLLWLIVNAPAK